MYLTSKYGLALFDLNRILHIKILVVFPLIIFISYILINLGGLFVPLIGNLSFPSEHSIRLKKLVRTTALFLLFFLVTFFLLKDTWHLSEQQLNRYNELLDNYHKSGYRIEVQNDIGDVKGIDLEAPCSELVSNQCGLSKVEVQELLKDKGLKDVFAITRVNVIEFTDSNHKSIIDNLDVILALNQSEYDNLGVQLIILDDDNIKVFEDRYGFSPARAFLQGELAYIEEYDYDRLKEPHANIRSSVENMDGLKDGDIVLISKQQKPIVVNKINYQASRDNGRRLNLIQGSFNGGSGQIIVHESFANRIGITTDYYQHLFFEPSFKAELKTTDRMMSKYGTLEYFSFQNDCIRFEGRLNTVTLEMNITLLSLIVTSIISLGIIINIILLDILAKQKEFGLLSLLGNSKKMNISYFFKAYLKPWMIGAFSSFIVAIAYLLTKGYSNYASFVLPSQRQSFVKYFIEGISRLTQWHIFKYVLLAFIIMNVIIIVVILIGLNNVLNKNPLENIQEREIKA